MSANRDEVMAEIRALLVKNFRLNGEDITPESTLKSLDLDSIDFIDLISELERNRKLRFAPNDFAGVKTIDNVVSILSGDAAPGSFAPKDRRSAAHTISRVMPERPARRQRRAFPCPGDGCGRTFMHERCQYGQKENRDYRHGSLVAARQYHGEGARRAPEPQEPD